MKKTAVLLLSLLLLSHFESKSQFLRAKVGVDVPMQYLLGLNYQLGKKVSFDLSGGIVASPWNNELYDVITVPGEYQARKEFLQETTDGGWVLGAGGNYHFGKWYAGIFGQRIQLNASGTYDYILNSDLLQEELTDDEKQTLDEILDLIKSNPISSRLVDFEDKIFLETVLYQLGLKVGRRFFFKNPRWEFRLELAFSKNMYAQSTSDYDQGLIDQILKFDTDGDLADRLDFEARLDELDDIFRDYGYIPTLNFGLTYLLFIPDKIKKEQEKLNLEKSAE